MISYTYIYACKVLIRLRCICPQTCAQRVDMLPDLRTGVEGVDRGHLGPNPLGCRPLALLLRPLRGALFLPMVSKRPGMSWKFCWSPAATTKISYSWPKSGRSERKSGRKTEKTLENEARSHGRWPKWAYSAPAERIGTSLWSTPHVWASPRKDPRLTFQSYLHV